MAIWKTIYEVEDSGTKLDIMELMDTYNASKKLVDRYALWHHIGYICEETKGGVQKYRVFVKGSTRVLIQRKRWPWVMF